MRLDIGCGHDYKGDINVDLFIKPTAERCDNHNKNTDTPLTDIPNLICAEATHLPFKSDVFDKVVSTHVIEHLDNPQHLLIEMKRVIKHHGLIHIITPHKLGNRHRWSAHKCSFTGAWFEAAFRVSNIKLVKTRKAYSYLPHPYMPLFKIPKDLDIFGRVNKQ